MKFPKLPCLVLLLSLQYLTAVAQVITIPTLSSSQGSTSTITFCIFDTVTFTATGDSGLTPLEYEFWIERGGAIVFPLGNGPQPQSSFTTNTLQDGDIVHARVWTYDNGGGNALTNTITINLDEFSRPISFSSDTINNTICGDEIVEFTVSNVISTTLFQFYVDGIFIQGPSHQTTFTYLITEASTVTLLAREGTCERRMDIPIQYNQLQPGSITGGGQFCHGEIPPIITSVNPATHNGDLIGALTPNTMYQWQSSFDGTQWTNILGAQQEEYNPPTLTQSVYFRRTVQYTHLGNHCETESNPIYFEVLPILNAGFIEQNDLYFCAGEVLPSLTVSNSTTGATMRYQWQQSIDAGGTYTNINNATSKHYTPSNLTTTTFFRRALYSAVSLNCEAFTPPIVMTYVALSPGSLDNSQNTGLCYNEFPAEISNGNAGSDATSNVGTISYLWQQSTDNVNWDLIAGANLSNYSPPRVQESTYFRRVAVNQQGSYSCSRTTNSIFIYVYDEVASGTLLGDQTICENGFPNFLSLSGTTSDSGIRYQWQMSSDNVNFTTISNNLSTLSIPTTATWYPMSTTYYRAIVRNINAPGCDAISNSVEIFVAPTAEVLQLTGPGPQQTVCPGDPIINATFSLTGSATFLSATGLAGSGLSFSGPVAGVYTLSGTPTADVAITITADGINPCADASYQYNVLIATVPSRPDLIRRDVNTAQNTIFNNGNLWYNNTLCQNTIGVTTTSFFPFELSTIVGIVNYEWKAEPSAAGSINATTGVMTWNPAFSGTATISVRSLGCAGNSTWLDNRFEIITDNRPAVTATTLSFPQALNRSFGDGQTGIAPMCQITNETPDTQYFATTASGVSDYQSIRWSIENIFVGGGITGVTSPGIIDPNTGVVDWNPNFYGSLDIKAEAINCDGNVDASSITTIQIGVEDNSIPNVITVSPTIIPSCPPQGNYSTSLFSNREVNWSLDNDNAGLIVSTATNTAEIRWLDDFSGSVRIRAEADGLCETGASELIAIVPGPASLQTLTGLDDVQLCEGDLLQGIPYTMTGFPSTANVTGLPNGLTGTLSATYHIVDVVYNGAPAAGQVYRLEILGQFYSYTVQVGDTADDIVVGLANEVSSLPTSNFNATRVALNTLRLQPKVAGVLLQGMVVSIPGFTTANVLQIESPQREYIISGTLNNATAGQYDYTITTEGGAPFCQQVSITGRITVVGTSSLTLDAGSVDEQTLCDFDSITPIIYRVENANSAFVMGLPPGLTYTANSSNVIISGSPQTNLTNRTVYTYTVSTANNVSGCLPEVTKTGTITIMPNHSIQLTSALGTDNQVICNSGPVGNLAPIEYTLGGGSTNPPIVLGNLPPGIVSNYDVVNNVLSITGTPTVNVAAPTIYSYGITTSGPSCSSVTLSGTITVNPNPEINLLTAVSTTDQTGGLAVCNNTPIQTIQYALFESPGFTITGLPNGVSASQSGNTITIEGTPNVTINAPRTYTYTLTTNGSDCQPELSVTGQIEVIPVPQIDVDFIHLNDVTHIQCFGGNDGAIRIPTDSPQLDLRIDGGLSSSAQMEEISLFNTPLLGDEYHITINGITYTHTVIASVFGGPVQSIAEIRDALINTINVAIGVNESRVTASANSTSSIRLIADEAGTAFTYTTNLQTTSLGANPPIMTTQQIAPNVLTNYVYAWSGPNGFSSSSLQIQNLSAGDYTLRVTAGSCFTEETFTINEPDPITAVNELCNGALKTSLSGGEGPYNLKLFDTQGNLLQTDTTSGIFTYTGLTPGFTYLLEVTDTNCSVPYQFSVAIPFELQFNPSYVQLTNDFCFQTPNTGEGSIVLGNLSGNAFSGGSGNFSYRWSGPTGTILAKDIFNLIPGDYTVTVTDNELGCTRSETFTISSNSPIVIALTNTNNLNSNGEIELPCIDGNAGLIEVNVSGGFGRYSYSWEKDGVLIPNSNTNRLEQLSIGDYTLTVTDVPPAGVVLSDLCQTSQVFSIVSPDILALVVNQNDIVQAQCFGQTVDIPVAIFGGAPPYTLTLDHLEVTTSSASYTFRDLDPASLGDTATISLSDRNNCQSAAVTVSIDLPNQYRFTGSTTDIDCSQNTLGTVQLMAEPSIGAEEVIIVEWYADTVHYFDTWENGNGLLDQIVNPGTYTVSVSNQAGCTLYSSSFEVEERSGQQLEVEIIQATSSTSCNQEQGRIDLAISKGYPPYTIQWQIQSNLNTWTLLPEYNNQAVVTGLSSGTYRAIISDRSAQGTTTLDCSPVITTRPIELIDQRLELINLQISTNTTGSCGDDATGEIFFELHNTFENELAGSSTLTFILDEQLLSEASTPQLSFDLLRQRYQIQHIAPGLHQLSVIANTASSTCQVTEDFTIEVTADPIAFSGSLLYDLDLCRNGVDIVIGNNDISGGIPFTGGSPYDLSWQFYPDVATGGSTQTFFGDTINNAQAGLYSLTIRDANLCEIEEPILIQVVPPEFSPFTIQGALMNPNTMQEPLVKVLPLECETSEGGTIGIEVIGGLRPLEINWFKQSTEINSSTSAYLPLHNYRNQTYLSGLEAGNYKMEIRSINQSCNGSPTLYTYYEEIITVEENPDLFIVSGPYIDSDICAGNPGRISIEVFNNNHGELFFYYNGVQVQEEDNPQVNEQTHTLLIESPVESARLQIVNELGCSLSKQVDLRLGEPNFTFTSASLESTHQILAREIITFDNVSTIPYLRSEWDFGDFSTPLSVLNTVTSTQVRYSYPVSGAYNVTLRIYNEAGCFKETTQQVAVGKGYSIILPNVFSPNNDGINDFFRPLISGLSTIRFSVYDQFGNLIYNENVSAPDDLTTPSALSIMGWDGVNAPQSPYFIYTVEGLLYDKLTVVEKTGTFLLLR